MKTIWKCKLDIVDDQYIEVPLGSQPLTVQYQRGELCLWVLVPNAGRPKTEQMIHVYGTGNPIPDVRSQYVGTVQETNRGRQFVWHVFWVTR